MNSRATAIPNGNSWAESIHAKAVLRRPSEATTLRQTTSTSHLRRRRHYRTENHTRARRKVSSVPESWFLHIRFLGAL